MSTYDQRTALFVHLRGLSFDNLTTLKPDQPFDPKKIASNESFRRGAVIQGSPETLGFGDGVYSRTESIYQIDIWTPAKTDSAVRRLDELADAHLQHFFPSNGRGLALIRRQASVFITKRPTIRPMTKEAALLRCMVEVDFYVEHYPS